MSGNSEDEKLFEGLKAVPKTIPCSFLYDSRGSSLYDKVPNGCLWSCFSSQI